MSEAAAAVTRLGREYETVYVMRPEVTRESAERIAKRVEEVVQRESGQLTRVENWGRRQMAFAVGKTRRAVYVYVRYVGGGRLVSELERNLRMLDDVIKYQTVRLRNDVDLAALTVNADEVKFEVVEPPPDDEPEETLARKLGLEGGYRDMHADERSMPAAERARDLDDLEGVADDDEEDES
jgi:small subunit ribosomal protein S6